MKVDKFFEKRIVAQRIAREFKDGYVINLGYGVPMMAANYLDKNINVILHSENGLVGLGPDPEEGKEDENITNSGGGLATITDNGAFFDTGVSFGIMRGGHIDLTVLGALQVDEHGNIANWCIPGKHVPGMGGAMDLVTGAKKVVVAMEHTNCGWPKILKKCTFPLTAVNAVDRIITELGVFDMLDGKLYLVEINPVCSVDDIEAATEASFEVHKNLKSMDY